MRTGIWKVSDREARKRKRTEMRQRIEESENFLELTLIAASEIIEAADNIQQVQELLRTPNYVGWLSQDCPPDGREGN